MEEQSPALRLADLDAVLTRLTLVWSRRAAEVWLESPNGHLDGRRPIDVMQSEGPAEVLAAIDAEAAGGYV